MKDLKGCAKVLAIMAVVFGALLFLAGSISIITGIVYAFKGVIEDAIPFLLGGGLIVSLVVFGSCAVVLDKNYYYAD